MATEPFPEADYQNLRQAVAVLQQRVATLECRLDPEKQQPTPTPDINGLEHDIVRITKELFPGDVTIKISVDPEYPLEPFYVVHAQATGEIKEIEDRRIEWHRRLRRLSPVLGELPLRIAIRK